jgi:sugar lactone lactonase YvrE
MKYELIQMRKQGSGAIVNNSSIGGLIGLPGRAIHHASKHGVLGLTKIAAMEYAPDSMRVDSDGNVYVAIYGQGRVLVFNKNGIPMGQILLPGRADEGHNLQSTSMAIKPGTSDLYIVTNDGEGGEGATIFHAKGFAKALALYSYQP